ncbi:hypothetical protein [Chelativorans sp. J32]|uniref:hypothetical protein n=1 Tax=Chelativorans sp. J32 TaxID=935840 RepID=UPI0004847AE9|nr:hypothetical protein [Chelativorans sp. J32]
MTDILRISVPLSAWLAAFSVVYGLQGFVCSGRWTAAGRDLADGHLTLIMVWAAATALQVAFLLALRSPRFASPSPFMRRLSVTLAVAALVATLWTLFPIAVSEVCL